MAYGYAPNTIMSKVLKDVYENPKNRMYIERIDDLIDAIEDYEYEEYEGYLENEIIAVIDYEDARSHNSKIILRTNYPREISWIIEELYEIYEIDDGKIDEYRFYDTIAYLVEIYEIKTDNVEEILKFIASVSVILLHPDHIIKDKFKVHPIKLPPFGKEF
jgi:hypothetical protein